MVRAAEARNCIECGRDMNPLGNPDETGPGTLFPGYLCVCKGCGAIHKLDERLQPAELNLRESAILAGDHDQMREIRGKIRKAHFARRARAARLN